MTAKKCIFFHPSLSFLAEAQPRKTGEDKRHFLAEVHIKFLGDRTNHKAKDIIGKITNLFCIYLFEINLLIDTY
jgi:hypothetical protein